MLESMRVTATMRLGLLEAAMFGSSPWRKNAAGGELNGSRYRRWHGPIHRRFSGKTIASTPPQEDVFLMWFWFGKIGVFRSSDETWSVSLSDGLQTAKYSLQPVPCQIESADGRYD
jgi:hypothetical protein